MPHIALEHKGHRQIMCQEKKAGKDSVLMNTYCYILTFDPAQNAI